LALTPHPPFEVRPADPGETFFRLLRGSEPQVEDFLSDEQDERVESLAATGSMALYRGFSVRNTLAQARRLAKAPGLRREYIAELSLTWKEGDAVARTLSTPGHHTLWGNPELLLKRVMNVHGLTD